MESRRNFIKKSSLITIGALNYNFSPIIRSVNGVDISVITYSFNPRPEDMNVIIQNCIDSATDNIELMGNHIERTLGMPRSSRLSSNWRSNVSMKLFRDTKKIFQEKNENNNDEDDITNNNNLWMEPGLIKPALDCTDVP